MKTRTVLVILTLLVSLSSCKKSATVTITGEVKNANGYKVRLFLAKYSDSYDSTIVKNNRFSFHPTVPEKGFYNIGFQWTNPEPVPKNGN